MVESVSQDLIDYLRMHPVLVGGLPRSGTTLFQSLLDGHPQLLVDSSESRFFYSYLPEAKGKSDSEKARLVEQIIFQPEGRFLDPDGDHYKTYFSHISYPKVKENFYGFLEQTSKQNPDFLFAAILAFGKVSGQLNEETKYWVEKTIYNERYTTPIFTWWPEAKFIHILRDPRDVYATWKKRDVNASRAITKTDTFAYAWKQSARLAHRNLRHFGEARYLIIHYEDLVQDPSSQMARVTQFLNIERNESLFTPSKVGGKHPWKGNSSRDTSFSGISSASVGRWRQRLTIKDVQFIETLLAKQMKLYGYQIETSPSIWHHIQVLPFRVKNVLRAVRDKLNLGRK